jgi:hypothetical protein
VNERKLIVIHRNYCVLIEVCVLSEAVNHSKDTRIHLPEPLSKVDLGTN